RGLVFAREIGALGPEDEPDADLPVGQGAHADAGVEDQVFADALGEDDLLRERAEYLESAGDERLLQLLRGGLGQRRTGLGMKLALRRSLERSVLHSGQRALCVNTEEPWSCASRWRLCYDDLLRTIVT